MGSRKLVERIEKLAKEKNKTLPEGWKDLSDTKINKTVLQPLLQEEQSTPEPTPQPQPTETPNIVVPAFTFAGKVQDVSSGEVIGTEVIDAAGVTLKSGYIQGLPDNRTGFTPEVRDLAKTLMLSKYVKTQQAAIAKLLEDIMGLIGYSWSNQAFKPKTGEMRVKVPHEIDKEWINWFSGGGAALLGQFSRLCRDPAFVTKYRTFLSA